MRIVCVVGMLDLPGSEGRFWSRWRSSFAEIAPDAEFVVVRHLYFPWQRGRMGVLARELVERFDDGRPVVLFGYSLGGCIARSAVSLFKASRVFSVLTLNSPHAVHRLFGLRYFPTDVPVVSIGSVLDLLVPFPLTCLRGSKKNVLYADHYVAYALSAGMRRKVLRVGALEKAVQVG